MRKSGSFRDFLVERRRVAGWTQEQLAERSGVSVRTIRNIEAGTIGNPRRASVELLLGALGFGPRAAAVDLLDRLPIPRQRTGGSIVEYARHVGAQEPRPWRERRPETECIIGRANDLSRIIDAVGQHRLVVLTGPGGVGKTRLALAAAERLNSHFRDGVAVVELGLVEAERSDPAEAFANVRRAISSTIFPQFSGAEESRREDQSSAPTKPQLLLIIDNAEHLVNTVGRLAQQTLTEHPDVRIVVTSRRPLVVTPAHVWEVGPLEVPDSSATASAAVELFLCRTAASCPTLDLADRPAEVAELCRRLEGVPLAIELAAHQIRSVPLHALLRGEPIARLLGQARAGGLPHQRTMSDSVRWSYDLLGEGQRRLLHQLARLFDRFTIEDLERVPPWDNGAGAGTVVGPLAELVDSSLIQVRRGAEYHYRLFTFVREYVNGLHYEPQPS